jgi:hypothetical protein
MHVIYFRNKFNVRTYRSDTVILVHDAAAFERRSENDPNPVMQFNRVKEPEREDSHFPAVIGSENVPTKPLPVVMFSGNSILLGLTLGIF